MLSFMRLCFLSSLLISPSVGADLIQYYQCGELVGLRVGAEIYRPEYMNAEEAKVVLDEISRIQNGQAKSYEIDVMMFFPGMSCA